MTTSDPAELSGLDLMRQHQEARNAPSDEPSLGRLIGMRFDEVEFGRMVISLETRPDFANPLGTVHGGVIATLLDSAMSCAIHTTLPPGTSYSTLELKLNYIRAGQLGGQRLTATGTVLHVGRRTGTAEGKVVDPTGKLIAHGTTTCIILGSSE